MRPGALVGERFVVGPVAGAGGMGTVYRALDRASGAPVALKILHAASEIQRFEREAMLLQTLDHPGIVRHVAHGADASGAAFIAMEWLEGQSLAQRLATAPPTVAESVALARDIVDALAQPHQLGVVHRDLKPSNLFLVGGDLARSKILDFGVAHGPGDRRLTASGTALGTPGYMAPEQARGESPIRPAADVFSLGCILFRCVTGRVAFEGREILDVLLKLVLEDPPRLRDLREDVPHDLDALVWRMLSKTAEERPADAAALARELDALGAVAGRAPTMRPQATSLIASAEQRVVSLLVARAPSVEGEIDSGLAFALEQRTHAAALRHRASHQSLVDGSQVVAFFGDSAATDQVARAADCALALRGDVEGAAVVLATGRGLLADDRASGEVIDRAISMLGAAGGSEVVVDELTAALLDVRFDGAASARSSGFFTLQTARGPRAAARTVLGRSTPFVGRAREVATLSALVTSCCSESARGLAAVVAPTGFGKSRLLAELLQRVTRHEPELVVWTSRGDPMRSSSAFSLLAPMIAGALGIHEADALEAKHELILRGTAGVAAARRLRVAHFLGELVGAPFAADASLELAAARRDPILLGDQILSAVVELFEVTCTARPLLVVLEDMQWGDGSSVHVIEHALRKLDGKPLVVLALGRPEFVDACEGLLRQAGSLEVRLGPLAARASEALVKSILPDAETAIVARIVERAQGNPLFVEELARAHAAGQELPETLIALVDGRLELLAPAPRRALRAASVFGRSFWCGGLDALLGDEGREATSRDSLGVLFEAELISKSSESRLLGQEEHVFASSLVRDAAYATLTDEARVVAHRLAAAWLEAAGERDARVLAEHLDVGEQFGEAAARLREAAAEAMAGNDFAAAASLAARALRCLAQPGAATTSPELLARLWLLQAEAKRWRGEIEGAEAAAEHALADAPLGSAVWFDAAGELAVLSSRLPRSGQLQTITSKLLETTVEPGAERSCALATARATVGCAHMGRLADAKALLARAELVAARLVYDPTVAGRLWDARARCALAAGDIGAYLPASLSAVEEIERTGDVRTACNWRVSLACAYLEHGAVDEGEAMLRPALEDAERMGLKSLAGYALHNLGSAATLRGQHEAAAELQARAADLGAAIGNERLEALGRVERGAALIVLGRVEEALAEVKRATAADVTLGNATLMVATVLAEALVLQGRAGEAVHIAREAIEKHGRTSPHYFGLALVCAEGLQASGDADGALGLLLDAREDLLSRAARIPDAGLRESFLQRIPAHARVIALANEALGL